MKTLLLASAKADLSQLRGYLLKNFSPAVWQSSYGEIKKAIRSLATFPGLGAIPPELEDLQLQRYRQLICGMNRIIYEVAEGAVYIHMIMDTRRDIKAQLLRRLVQSGTASVNQSMHESGNN